MSTSTVSVSEQTDLPDSMAIDILMECKPSTHKWLDVQWDVLGVVAGQSGSARGLRQVNELENAKHFLYSGLRLGLFEDECESYYHNLRSPQPGCFVVARRDENDLDAAPEPFVVTLSFDEAHSYQEGDDLVYAVPIPAELYQWTEAYVINHYVAEKRIKRKRKDWKHGEGGGA